MTDRAEYIAGLRQLADLLDHHEEIPLPWEGSGGSLGMHFWPGGGDPKARMAAAARALPSNFRKNNPETDPTYYRLYGSLHGLKIELAAYREAVCERVVVGTEVVVKQGKDPAAVAALPDVTICEDVEQVEWVCHPLLVDAEAGAR